MKRKLQKEICLSILMVVLFALVPFGVMAVETISENDVFQPTEYGNANGIITKDSAVSVEYASDYQDGFMANSLAASRSGDKIIVTLDYYGNRDCDYSFFNPPHGDVIMKRVYGGIKSGSNTTKLELSLYDLKRIMANETITMKFGFDDRASWIYFKTAQLSTLAAPGELENLPDEILPTTITLNKASLNLTVGTSEQLTPTLSPGNINDSTVTWRSSDSSIATVDANGNIQGISSGTAVITATTINNLAVQCRVEISKVFDGSVEYASNYQDGFMVNSLAASRSGDKIIVTLDYFGNRDCDYSFFNPPNGDVIMKCVYDGIKSGSNTTKLELSLYDLKRIMANETITMKFGFDDRASWIYFKTAQLSTLAAPGELENLPDEVLPTSITLNKASLNLTVGTSEQLTPTLRPGNITDSTVTWRSSDSSIATVDANGNIQGISSGTAVITATTINNLAAQCRVEISKVFDGSVEYASEYQDGFMVNSLAASRSGDKIIVTLDYFGNRDCDYSFFNPPNGDVIMKCVYDGIKSGSNTTKLELSLYDLKRIMANETITMKFGFDDRASWIYFKTAQLSTLAAPGELENLPDEVLPTSITLNKASLNLTAGTSEQLTPTLSPGNITDSTVTWYSSDSSIATVDANGNIQGISSGTAVITATTINNLAAQCMVEISKVFDGSVEYASNYQDGFMVNSLAASRSGDKIIVTLDYFGNRDCDYSFFNPPNGDVIMKCVYDGIKSGSNTTKLELSLYDLKRIMANETITMKFGFDDRDSWINFKTAQLSTLAAPGELENLPDEILPTSITLNKASLNLTVGTSEQLTPILSPGNINDSTVTWRSSDSSIATVDANGNIQGISSGTAVITATTINNFEAACEVHVSAILLGDVDANTKVQAFDALMTLQIATGKKIGTPEEIEAADVSHSGNVEAFDALRILQYATGKITEF